MMCRILRTVCAFTGAGALAAVVVGLYARYIEPKWLDVTELDLSGGSSGDAVSLTDMGGRPSPTGPPLRDGDNPLTIAFVTDLHVGPHFSGDDLAPTVQALERIRPDVILFGGDFICESPRFLRELETPLRRMTATATLGSWGILGNHDIANIRARVLPVLKRCGVTMLANESARLRDDLWVVGIDDVLLGKSDIPASFADVPENARTIALWHEPDLAERVAEYKPMIVLSGHTHGGQVRLPGIGALATPKLGKQYVAGQFDVDGMPLYVSRGIGMYRPPVRLNCRPELVILRTS